MNAAVDMSDSIAQKNIGLEMRRLMGELYPICRSITGNGVRETLRITSQHIPIEIHDVPTGTQVFDWSVPKEWDIKDAYVKNSRGERIVDFRRSNLHVVNYSVPVIRVFHFPSLRLTSTRFLIIRTGYRIGRLTITRAGVSASLTASWTNSTMRTTKCV